MRCSKGSTISADRAARARFGAGSLQAALVACACVLAFTKLLPAQSTRHDFSSLPSLALLREAVVNGPTVRLADLLPGSADSRARATAETTVLGRAPELGSIRVFTAEELARACAGKMRVDIPQQVIVRRNGWPVTGSAIREALIRTGAAGPTDAVEVVFPPDLVTRSERARLKVVSFVPGRTPNSATARLRCADRTDCGTFLVALGGILSTTNRTATRPSRSPAFAALVQPGKKARLVMTGGGMKIMLPVFPLNRTGLGESVRVLDPAARRILVAQVRGQNLLGLDEVR